jgi:propanol-preferring alcohol dehydrogenase
MRAWEVRRPGPVDGNPLEFVEREAPLPDRGEILVRVSACGVCRTDLHVAEGDLPPHRPNVIPGHEIVGRIDALGPAATRWQVGARVGIAWLRRTCGRCRFCTSGRENLCISPEFTGWDADGGYADYAVVPEDYAYEIPEGFDDQHAAPLLCAGIIGYRALRRSQLPRGGRLGVYGFGGSAHIASQVAIYEGADVYVVTRGSNSRGLAMELGARWAGDLSDKPPVALDAGIVFAPVGTLVPIALEHLDRGATLAIAGIHMTDIPTLEYERHLFQERNLVSVTANTRSDGRELLEIAARIPAKVTTTPFALEEADDALRQLAHGKFPGAAVLLT